MNVEMHDGEDEENYERGHSHGHSHEHDCAHHDEHEHARRHWMKHWMRHTAMVPKGFLRFQLLKMLLEKPMSGSEIMSELESETNGYWKPSPGSIYPLLAWLQDQTYIKEADQKEPGIRRYTLTEQGKTFLENEKKSREEIDKRLEHFGSMWYGFDQERRGELRNVAREFGKAVRDVFHEVRREHSKEAIEQSMKSLEEITMKLQDLAKRLREHDPDVLQKPSKKSE
jgi:DNA-binding PadR family transcriptional regulator